MARCCMTVQKTGKQCRWPGVMMVGGLWVCEYHIRAAAKMWQHVQDKLPGDVLAAAIRDTTERNAERHLAD